MTSFQKTDDILQNHPLNNSRNVNNVGKKTSSNVKNVKPSKELTRDNTGTDLIKPASREEFEADIVKQFEKLLERFTDERARIKCQANTLEEELGDFNNKGCYRWVIKKWSNDSIFRALAEVKYTAKYGTIKRSKAALFIWLLKNKYGQLQTIDKGV